MQKSKIAFGDYSIEVNHKGAELCALYWQNSQHNWIWSGASWNRHAPVLFPIVGRLKNDQYQIGDKAFRMGQHGFARDQEFALVAQTSSSLHFQLSTKDKVFADYPYQFELNIHYHLSQSGLAVQFSVKAFEDMYFSLGWHPGFTFPQQEKIMGSLEFVTDKLENYYQLFDSKGLIAKEQYAVPGCLVIDEKSFAKDALIYTEGVGEKAVLRSSKDKVKLVMTTADAPQFGLWSKNPAEFVCLEPWWGCADLESTEGRLENKFGIQSLTLGQEWTRTVSLSLLSI